MVREARQVNKHVHTDDEIHRHVIEQLKWDDRIDADNIAVDVHDGQVTLTGTVTTYAASKAAVESARSVLGVSQVHCQLAVLLPGHTRMPEDTEVRLSAINTLTWNPEIEPTNIDVGVENGVVTLKGSVESYAQKVQAADLVASLQGVRDVKNQLKVAPPHDFLDDAIADDILAALKRNLPDTAGDITVDVTDGVATLSGTVRDPAASYLAERVAIKTRGVLDVLNRLRANG